MPQKASTVQFENDLIVFCCVTAAKLVRPIIKEVHPLGLRVVPFSNGEDFLLALEPEPCKAILVFGSGIANSKLVSLTNMAIKKNRAGKVIFVYTDRRPELCDGAVCIRYTENSGQEVYKILSSQ